MATPPAPAVSPELAEPTIREELLAVAGVAEAEVDLTDGVPSGVRLRLNPDADPAAIGERVQTILSAHGIRARVGVPEWPPAPDRSGPPPPPGAPGGVVSLAGFEAAGRRGPVEVELDEAQRSHAGPEPAGPVGPGTPAPLLYGRGLAGVSVEETREGVVVTVSSTDGHRQARRGRWSEGGLNETVVAAVAALAGEESMPVLRGVQQVTVAGTATVVVVLERLGGRSVVAGAAVVEAGVPFALARAVWAALRPD